MLWRHHSSCAPGRWSMRRITPRFVDIHFVILRRCSDNYLCVWYLFASFRNLAALGLPHDLCFMCALRVRESSFDGQYGLSRVPEIGGSCMRRIAPRLFLRLAAGFLLDLAHCNILVVARRKKRRIHVYQCYALFVRFTLIFLFHTFVHVLFS